MSFKSELLELTGAATDSYDIRALVRRCFFYDFDGYPTYLWDGQGVLTTKGGQEWLGTIDATGVNHHVAPAVQDSRDGVSPRYAFKIPNLDKETFDAIKADQNLAKGRTMTCYSALFKNGEGLLPATPIRFDYRLTIRGLEFSEEMQGFGSTQAIRSATALMRSQEAGRSLSPGGTITDTSQQERARLLGLDSDSGCSFVAANSRRTFIVGG